MPVVAQAPAPVLFGPEVADDISKNKSLLTQITSALTANGVAVTLPPSFSRPDVSANKSGTPYACEIEWVKNLQDAIVNGTKAAYVVLGATAARRVRLEALVAGVAGKSITVTIEAGSMSGMKVTITNGGTPEVYDNVTATAAAMVTAIQGVSLLVSATKISDGGIEVMSVTHLAAAATWSVPTFALGENDNQSIFISKWAKALFDGLVAAGFIA